MNSRKKLIEQIFASIHAGVLRQLSGQGVQGKKPHTEWLSSQELQKLMLNGLMDLNPGEAQSAPPERGVTDPRAICAEAIERARQSSAVVVRLANRAEPAPAWRPRSRMSFAALMSRFPHIAHDATRMYMQSSTRREDSLPRVHRYVLNRLSQEGLSQFEYPFSCRSCGYGAFAGWLCRRARRQFSRNATGQSWRNAA